MDKVTYLQGKVDKLDDPRDRQPVVLRHIADIVAERREVEWLIEKVIEKNVMAVLAGPRGTFKSFVALHWSMKAAVNGHAVVILSGEGGGLDRRVDAWMRTYGSQHNLAELPIRALERRLTLSMPEDLMELREGIGDQWPSLIVIDTLSKYSAGVDLNSPKEMGQYLNTLATMLREHYRCTILLVAHSGHADMKRPMGSYKLMADPDAEFIIARAPDSMLVSITRERFKDYPSLPPLAYEAETIDLGRTDKYGEPVNSLILRPTQKVVERPKAHIGGKAQRTLFEALKARQKASDDVIVWTIPEMRRIARECGINKSSAHAATEALVMSPLLVNTIGGCRLASEKDA